LTAATTLPCAEMSRVSVPRLTAAMRTLEELTAEPAEISRATVGTTQIRATSTAAAAAPMTIQRLRDECVVSIRRSWAEVSRIICKVSVARVRRMSPLDLIQQRLCQALKVSQLIDP